MIFNRKYHKPKKAYSLLEVIISLAIVGMAITIMFNFLILSLQVSLSSFARSFIREEISNNLALISRDIRNADKINNCGQNDIANSCEIILDGEKIVWSKCGQGSTQICKDKILPTGEIVNLFTSSSNFIVSSLDFVQGYLANTSNTKINIIVTISGDHANKSLKVKNIIKQSSISTRNYELTL
jgi:prepilin-type N-terminal cleavage/methylation domain-containing protein